MIKKYGYLGVGIVLAIITIILFVITAIKLFVWLTVIIVAIISIIVGAALDSVDGNHPRLFGLTGLIIFVELIIAIGYWLLWG